MAAVIAPAASAATGPPSSPSAGAAEDGSPRLALSQEQVAEFQEAFSLFDLDGGGDIDAKELGTVMRSLGANPTEAEVAAMIAEVDTSGNGSIEFDEFCHLMARKLHVSDCVPELRETFHVYDEHDTGYISADALREIVAALADGLSDEEVDEIVRLGAYEDGFDGRINFDRFRALMMLHTDPGMDASSFYKKR